MALPLVLATVMIDPPTALFAGCVVALISFKLIARDPQREIMKTAAYGAIWSALYVVAVSFMYFLYPDWMFVYLRDAKNVPMVPIWALFMLASVGAGALGALGTGVLLSFKKMGLAIAATVGALLFLLLLVWLGGTQYVVVGTMEQYVAGKAPPLLENAHAQTYMNIAGGITAVVSIAMIVLRIMQTRKLSAQPVAAKPAA